jgi:hypothetical protein
MNIIFRNRKKTLLTIKKFYKRKIKKREKLKRERI